MRLKRLTDLFEWRNSYTVSAYTLDITAVCQAAVSTTRVWRVLSMYETRWQVILSRLTDRRIQLRWPRHLGVTMSRCSDV